MIIVAIEGLCFAGKLTLAAELSERLRCSSIVVLPDYTDLCPPEERPALPAATPSAELAALEYYISLDRLRWEAVQEDSTRFVIIQDRSVHTLLAHVYSNDLRTGFGVFPEAIKREAAIPSHRRANVVLYLDAREETLLERYRTIPNRLPTLLTTPSYMRGFRAYFLDSVISVRSLAVVNANQLPAAVAEDVIRILEGIGVC